MDNSKRLWRSDDRMIAGVCSGFAEFVGWSPTTVRVLYVLVSIFSAAFPGLIAYLILWIAMPKALPPAAGSSNGGAAGSLGTVASGPHP